MRFTRRRGAVSASLDAGETALLSTLAGDLLGLLAGPDDEAAGDGASPDPLAELVGLSTGPVERPTDPALARLLPDAYGDDEAASAEFRRFTEQDLRAGKRANAGTVLATLAPLGERGGRMVLDRDQVDAWLGTLNDLRLVLATRLGVDEDTDLDPEGDDPRSAALHVFGWLGWLQETLLRCVEPRPAQ